MSNKKKLDKSAVQKANTAFYAKHPKLKGKQLSGTDPKQAALRKEWMRYYKTYKEINDITQATNDSFKRIKTTEEINKLTQGMFDAQKRIKETIAKCKRRKALIDKIKNGKSSIKVEGSEDFKKKTYAALDRLAQTKTGKKLLDSLDSSSKTTTIKETDKGNSESAANWNDGLYDRTKKKKGSGTNTTVVFNPDRDRTSQGKRDPAIGLGHELIHAHHDTHGTTDGRKNVEYNGADGKKRKAPGYELQTVGLGEYKDNDITENKLRKEFNDKKLGKFGKEKQRPHY